MTRGKKQKPALTTNQLLVLIRFILVQNKMFVHFEGWTG